MTQSDAEAALIEVVRLIERSQHYEALGLLDAAEAAFGRHGSADRLRAVRQRRMMIYPLIGRLNDAVVGNRELLGEFLASGDAVAAAKVRTNLGFNLSQAGDGAGAAAQFRLAGRVFRAHRLLYEQATCYMNLGSALLATRPRASRAYVTVARDLFAESGHQDKVGDCVILIARHADRDGNHDLADRLRQEVQTTCEQMGDRVRAAHVRYVRGSAAGRRGDYELATELLSAALREFLRARPPTNLELADCARRLAMSHRALDDPRAAWPFALLAVVVTNEVRTSLKEPRLRRTTRDRRATVYSLALELGVILDEPEAVWSLIEATRSQQEPVPPSTATADPVSPQSATQAPGLGGSVNREVGLRPLPGFMVRGRNPLEPLNVLGECAARLGVRIEDVSLRLRTPEPVVGLDVLATNLSGPNGLWWSTVVVEGQLFWAGYSDGTTSTGIADFGPNSRMRKAVDCVLSGLPVDDAPSRREFDRQSVQWRPGGLFDSALCQLAGLLPDTVVADGRQRSNGSAPPTTVWAPARELARLPIGLIPVMSSGRRLINHTALVYCPSPALAATRYLSEPNHRAEPSASRQEATAIADPSHIVAGAIIDPLGDLPTSRVLGRRAIAVVGARSSVFRLRRPPEATRGHVSALLATVAKQSGTGSIVVIAAHTTPGEEDDPLAAAILLKDGPLTARELLTADGRDRYPLPERVLFASCSSAGLTTPDWAGLTAAASWLGTTSAVASLWPLTTGAAAARFDLKVLEATTKPDIAEALREIQAKELARWSKPHSMRILYRKHQRDPRIWTAYVVLAV